MPPAEHDIRLHFLFELPAAAETSGGSHTSTGALPAPLPTTSTDTEAHSGAALLAPPAPAEATAAEPAALTRFAIDASVPNHMPLLALLPDLLALAKEHHAAFHTSDFRWQALTPAGTLVAVDRPLLELGLQHGSTVLLRPYRSVPAPMIKDAAEALAQVAAESRHPAPTLPYTSVAGVWGLFACGCALSGAIPPTFACLAAVTAAIIGFLCTGFRGHLLTATFLAGTGSFVALIHTTAPAPLLASAQQPTLVRGFDQFWHTLTHSPLGTLGQALALSSIASVLAAGIAIAGRGWLQHTITPHIRAIALLGVCSIGALLMSLAFVLGTHLHQSFREAAIAMGLLGMLWALLIIVVSPALATKISGVPITRLPSAGQSLEVSDAVASPGAMQQAALRATWVLEGVLCGAACCLAASLSLWMLCSPVARSGIGVMCLLCVGTLLLHAHRHHRNLVVRSLWLVTLYGIITLIWTSQGHWFGLVVGAIAALACALAPWWARYLRNMAPTTMVWFERLECACLAIALPLGCYLLHLFEVVRGLSL